MQRCQLSNRLITTKATHLSCGHVFEASQLTRWLSDHDDDCPVCFQEEEDAYNYDSDSSAGSLDDFIVDDSDDDPWSTTRTKRRVTHSRRCEKQYDSDCDYVDDGDDGDDGDDIEDNTKSVNSDVDNGNNADQVGIQETELQLLLQEGRNFIGHGIYEL